MRFRYRHAFGSWTRSASYGTRHDAHRAMMAMRAHGYVVREA